MPTRWPTLRPIDEPQPAWLRPGHLKALRSVCARIKSRARVDAFIDTFRRKVVFGYLNGGDVALMDIACPLYRACGVEAGFDPILDAWHEDEIVRVVGLSRVKARVKERWREQNENAKKHEESEQIGSLVESGTPQVEEFMRRRHESRGMGRHYRRSHLVQGIKGKSR